MMVDLPEEFVTRMRELAKKPMNYENEEFEVMGYSGGNVDDAYALGEDEGEKGMAREIASFFPKVAE